VKKWAALVPGSKNRASPSRSLRTIVGLDYMQNYIILVKSAMALFILRIAWYHLSVILSKPTLGNLDEVAVEALLKNDYV
jgi:hypothetical protein